MREPDTEVATAEASFCKVELESEVAGARPIETNDYNCTPENGHSAEILNGKDRDKAD